MHVSRGTSVAFLIGFFLVIPVVTHAALAANCEGPTCTFKDGLQIGKNILSFLLATMIPITAGLFAWAGILWFTSLGNPQKIAKFHAVFKTMVIGVFATFGMYLFFSLYTRFFINRDPGDVFTRVDHQFYETI